MFRNAENDGSELFVHHVHRSKGPDTKLLDLRVRVLMGDVKAPCIDICNWSSWKSTKYFWKGFIS